MPDMSGDIALAKELVSTWSGYVAHLDDPDWDGEELAEFIDLVDFMPDEFDEAHEGIRSSLVLVHGLNRLLGRGLDSDDHQAVLDALTDALRRLGSKIGVEVPSGRPH